MSNYILTLCLLSSIPAFSFFSSFEYGIAIVNIMFHYTAQFEFQGLNWYVAYPSNSVAARQNAQKGPQRGHRNRVKILEKHD